MHIFAIKKILFLSMSIFYLISCATIFENNYDVMARHALFNLMESQEIYRAKHDKYANELAQLSSYDLKYHTGIVYLEIQSAS